MSGLNDLTQAVVRRMRDERYRRGWSALELCEHLERQGTPILRSVIVNLENDRRDNLTIDEVVALSRVFNTTIDWLMYGRGFACIQCSDKPPAGFTCNDCGKSLSARVEDILDQSAFQTSYVTGRS